MSVRVAPQYIREVKQAYKRRCHTQQRLAEALGMNRDTISKFVNGKFISYSYFEEICQKLGLSLEKIADFEIEEREPSDSSERLSSLEERLLGYGGLSDLQSPSDPVEPPPQQTFPVLFDRILEIDFKEQSQRFKQVIELQRTAGFLVHGEPCYGQQFLLNRLLRLIPGRQNQSPIKIDVSSSGVGKSIPNLWRELTACLQLPREATPTEIMDRVCDRWQTQDVIFVFYTVDYMPLGILSEWLQEFWEPLVTRAKKSLPQGDRHLLMFLVDNCGSVGQSNVRLAENFEQPECGKTRLAEAVAYELGLPYEPWYVKSTSQAQDGLYTYDAVRRLHDAQLVRMGEKSQSQVENLEHYIKMGALGRAFQNHQRTVVLIDEIDKADIDFPNDLLRELDEQTFVIEETGEKVKAVYPPIVFITSNDEKDLPDAFLRRCLFHYIEFPGSNQLVEMINAHFPVLAPGLVEAAVERFAKLREKMVKGKSGKKVSTSELLD